VNFVTRGTSQETAQYDPGKQTETQRYEQRKALVFGTGSVAGVQQRLRLLAIVYSLP